MTRILMNRWFQRFAAKERIGSQALIEAIERANRGLIDADLGGGVIKQRVARPGQGRPGGYRTLILFRVGSRAVFAFGFAKSDQANIAPADHSLLKDTASMTLGLTEDDIARLVATGQLIEVLRDGD
jgi:hypothetical protein